MTSAAPPPPAPATTGTPTQATITYVTAPGPSGWANLRHDLFELEGILAALGSVQGVVVAILPVGTPAHIASGVFAGASILGLCLQKMLNT